MLNTFYSSSNLITNFKPKIFNELKNYNDLKKKNNQKFCKNFLIYVLLFKYKSKLFKKSNIFIKKYKNNVYTVLRSPYRHKLARHQISIQRYKINFSLWISIKKTILIINYFNLLKLVKFLKKFSNIFESNLIFVENIKFSINLKFNNNFYIKKFKNK